MNTSKEAGSLTRQSAVAIVSAVLLAAVLAFPAADAVAQTNLEDQPGIERIKHIPQDQIPKYVASAVNSPDRPAADRRLDLHRKPEQIMTFFGIAPGMKVADLSAFGGYTTDLLARIVGKNGTVYSQNPKLGGHFAKAEKAWRARLKEPGLGNIVEVTEPFDSSHLLPVKANSLDAVLINLNYHDLVWMGVNRQKMNASVFKALKPGGVYGIVDNSAPLGSGTRDTHTLHRIDENFVIREVEKTGFKLSAACEALRNPKDDRTWLIFKHRGEQDQFALKFTKPK